MGAIWNFGKGTGLLEPIIRVWGTKGLFKGLGALDQQRLETKHYFNSKYKTVTIAFVLHECQTWSLALRKEHRLRCSRARKILIFERRCVIDTYLYS